VFSIMGLHEFDGKKPKIHPEAYVSPRASLLGDVEIGEDSSVWEFAVIRADMNYIKIGKGTSIQDNATVHCEFMNPTTIGDYVTAGHNSMIHGAEIGNNVVVGIGAIVLSGAKIGENSVIGAGAVVTERTEIPPNSLVLGMPGKVVKEISETMREGFKMNAQLYVELSKKHKEVHG
jgi:carbonic anhydrase/acetyltransferase-like protein (isoleucine patch superfamily)